MSETKLSIEVQSIQTYKQFYVPLESHGNLMSHRIYACKYVSRLTPLLMSRFLFLKYFITHIGEIKTDLILVINVKLFS